MCAKEIQCTSIRVQKSPTKVIKKNPLHTKMCVFLGHGKSQNFPQISAYIVQKSKKNAQKWAKNPDFREKSRFWSLLDDFCPDPLDSLPETRAEKYIY